MRRWATHHNPNPQLLCRTDSTLLKALSLARPALARVRRNEAPDTVANAALRTAKAKVEGRFVLIGARTAASWNVRAETVDGQTRSVLKVGNEFYLFHSLSDMVMPIVISIDTHFFQNAECVMAFGVGAFEASISTSFAHCSLVRFSCTCSGIFYLSRTKCI